ncbi:RNA-guided endonuclease InsQ/TnpB family protein [Microbispora amethystogenes]|uniref:Transposase n=1 Tax=Microbispora amethystogenes TaxID=1427754 RepID=A0ABQ4FJS0_9ACTN|nr:RNA-guided endonuclease TnpB family protein [Microbispora amethystogenes]GIH35013.1 transposase [Microbispora amethystogenes]
MEVARQARAHVARLDLTAAQMAVLDGQAHAARALWNLLHEFCTFRQGRLATVQDCDAAIRQARREIDWMGRLPAQAAQAVLRTYRQAWANFFDPGHPAGRPGFKSRSRSRPAVDVPQGRDLNIARLNRRWGAVNLPKVGRVRFRWTRDLPGVTRGGPAGRITGARLVKDAFGWQIVFRTEAVVAAAPVAHRGEPVAIDRGITVALALSDGTMREHGPWLRDGEKQRLRRLEKKSARQRRTRTPGRPMSRRLARTYDRIARLRATAKRRALNWQHQTTTELARTFGVVVVEDLTITTMVRSAKGTVERPGRNVRQKAGLNRAITGQAWGRTVTLLEYKTRDRGGLVVKVPAAGTSQTCHRCGHRDPAARNGIRYACVNPACGWAGHADTNAAINIRNAAGTAVSGRGDLGAARSAKRQPPRAA